MLPNCPVQRVSSVLPSYWDEGSFCLPTLLLIILPFTSENILFIMEMCLIAGLHFSDY